MKDYQKAEVKMMQTVVHFFDKHPELEENNPILKTHIAPLRELLKQIVDNEIKQNYVNTGYTKNKKTAKHELANLDLHITSSICSFANDTGKNELYNEFRKPISVVKTMSDSNFVIYNNIVAEKANIYAKELKSYHITADELLNLAEKIKAYYKILLIPAELRKTKSVATVNIKTLITKGLKTMRRSIDRDMIHYKASQPDLYQSYRNMREIDDNPTTALSIMGTITADQEPARLVQYVKVTAKFKAGAKFKEMHAVSTQLGNYQFKGIPNGKCTLTFTLEYYDTLTKRIAVYSDKATKLNVEIVKS